MKFIASKMILVQLFTIILAEENVEKNSTIAIIYNGNVPVPAMVKSPGILESKFYKNCRQITKIILQKIVIAFSVVKYKRFV